MSRKPRSVFGLVAGLLTAAAVFLLSGCSTVVPDQTTHVIGGNEVLTAKLADDLSAKGVVAASVIIVAGDIEKSVKAGIVTRAEADAAQKAINDGTLDLWRRRMQSDLEKQK